MYFKRIDMQGFKSFADPVSVEFHDGITCIVGPNGSGKSNISDALRWVLGEQSPKMLRGGKMEEVIFAGTTNRKSRGMAEVTLVIDNSTGILPIDYNEVAITRRMYRSGESEYAINNTVCRLRDVRELIMDTGIGVDGYSIIGQGKISEMVSNKPESRREIFEEAAGIVKYRSKKAEAERKMETAAANLERVDDIVGEIEGRIGGLAEDSKKASEYLVLRERQKSVEINIALKNIENVELKNEYLKDDITETGNAIDGFKDKKSEIDRDISENRQRNGELDQLEGQTRDRLLQQVEEINELTNRTQLNNERLQSMEKDKERLRNEIADIAKKMESENFNVAQMDTGKRDLEEQLSALKERWNEKKSTYAKLNNEVKALESKIEFEKNKIYELSAHIGAKGSEKSGLENLRDTLKRRKEQILSDTKDNDQGNDQIQKSYEEAVQRKEEIERQKEQLTKMICDVRKNGSDCSAKEGLLKKKMEDLRLSMGQAISKKKMFEDLEGSYEGYNYAVKFIMKQKIDGIHGIVADLLEVPKGFEKAIETALGAALQNVVCRDDQSAQKAVTLLKNAKAGRLTFLPIASIRSGKFQYEGSMKSEAGFQGFGVECIEFDSKYKNIMEYLLGRVVIVDRLENAVRLSKKASGGLRFVTLEGEVINVSGAITGGTYKTNSANLLSRKTEIQELGQEIEKMKFQKTEGEEALTALSQKIERSKAESEELDSNFRSVELSLMSKENELQHFKMQLSDLSQSQEKQERELKSLETEENSSAQMIEKIEEEIRCAKEEMNSLERDLEERIPLYTEKKALAFADGEKITNIRMEVATVENKRDSAIEMEERIRREIKNLKSEKEEKELQILRLEQDRDRFLSGDTDLFTLKEKKEEEKKEAESNLTKIQEEKGLIVRYLAEIEKKKSEMDEILFRHQQQKYEFEVQLAKNETQVTSYKDRLWEDFEVSYIQAVEFESEEFVMSQAMKESREIKGRIKQLGDVNVGAIKEYETLKERYQFLSEQRADLLEAMNSLKEIIEDMDKTIRQSFKESFDQIMVNFEESFRELFGGGHAELRMEDETKPLESGIEIVAQPPGKKLQNINLMSGGEKTMTAIALMFAVLKAKPTPFCILDEVEAALDEANIDRFAKYLRNFKEVQFALITHQKATMEFADVLYGVTMPEQGISKVLSLRLGDHFEG